MMPEPWELAVIVSLAYATAVYLSYLQWLSDDSNFYPQYKPFEDEIGDEENDSR